MNLEPVKRFFYVAEQIKEKCGHGLGMQGVRVVFALDRLAALVETLPAARDHVCLSQPAQAALVDGDLRCEVLVELQLGLREGEFALEAGRIEDLHDALVELVEQ